MQAQAPFILAGGLTPDNVAAAVKQVRPWLANPNPNPNPNPYPNPNPNPDPDPDPYPDPHPHPNPDPHPDPNPNPDPDPDPKQVRPWCVDVSSGVETDGVKDVAKMQAYVRNAKAVE